MKNIRFNDNQPTMILAYDEHMAESKKGDEFHGAYLIRFEDREVWIPKSQCQFVVIDNLSYLEIYEWLALEKGLEQYAI